MKHLLLAVLFLLPFTFNAQKSNTDDLNRYLRKSTNQKKTANILLLTGGGLMVTGLLVGNSGNEEGTYFFSENQIVGFGVFSVGVLTSLISVPFYISAHHNKKKLMKLSPAVGITSSNSVIVKENYALVGMKVNF